MGPCVSINNKSKYDGEIFRLTVSVNILTSVPDIYA